MIGIIGMSNLRLMPYLFHYTNFLMQNNVDFEVIYWDRKGLDEISGFKTYIYQQQMNDFIPQIFKIRYFIRYIKFVKRVIRKNKYDFLVVLTSVPSVLLSKYLCQHYEKRYVIDIRDKSYEHIPIYNMIFRKSLQHSALNVISSPGFIKFLPYKQATLCHNISFNINGNRNIRSHKPRIVDPIKICYIGNIAYFDRCVEFLKGIANDLRFEFHFHGMGEYNSDLEDYCITNRIHNVAFHGAYESNEKELIYGQTDIIFNIYGNETENLSYALSNKAYDAAWYRIPILVSPFTFMHKFCEKLSFAINPNTYNITDLIFNWYTSINWLTFEADADQLIKAWIKENKIFDEILLEKITNS